MGRMHAPGKGISSSAIVSNYLVEFSKEFYGVFSSHTEDLSHHGKSNLPKKSRTSSTSSPRRVTSHHSLVSTSEIPTVLVNPTTWLDPRSSVFSNPWELPQNFQKISTSWSRNSSISPSTDASRCRYDDPFHQIILLAFFELAKACCWHEKAFGKKPKGQGRQIPFDSYWI